MRNEARKLTFERFVDGFANASAPRELRALVSDIVNAPQMVGGWAWSAHFASTLRWVGVESRCDGLPRRTATSPRCYSANLSPFHTAALPPTQRPPRIADDQPFKPLLWRSM